MHKHEQLRNDPYNKESRENQSQKSRAEQHTEQSREKQSRESVPLLRAIIAITY
jgi:hypothetical protein